MPKYAFPASFLWGAATASYQIEGAVEEEGRGPSIWDVFCAKPGAIREGQSGRHACDHYHRWKDDLDLLERLGFGAYRFSVAWPRIFPGGTGAVNLQGLDFYDRLVDGLLERKIEPMLTLYHWDLPQALEDKGGWRSRATAEAFAPYAAIVAQKLGDRVKLWATHNEMPCIVGLGYRTGEHAPGARESEQVIRRITHNVLLAHGLGVQAIRSEAKKAEVGIVHNPFMTLPFTEREEDIRAAREAFIEDSAWMLDPIFRGSYPAAQRKRLGKDAPEIKRGDLKTIAQPLDWFGLNLYTATQFARADIGPRSLEPHFPRTDMSWPITEEVLYWALRFIHELYAPPAMYITENGACYPDQVNADGRVEDYARLAYIRAHLRGVHRAASEKIPVKGYFAWSLLDNFEWGFGYAKRFGIVHVNFETQKRTPKASAEWLSKVIQDKGF